MNNINNDTDSKARAMAEAKQTKELQPETNPSVEESPTEFADIYSEAINSEAAQIPVERKRTTFTLFHLYCAIHFRVIKMGTNVGGDWMYVQIKTEGREWDNKLIIRASEDMNVLKKVFVGGFYVARVQTTTAFNIRSSKVITDVKLVQLLGQGKSF